MATLFARLNCSTQLYPNKNPAPLGDMTHPSISSGSDHIRSHIDPAFGIYCFLSIERTSSIFGIEGDKPP